MEERELLHTDGLSVGYHGRELIKEIGISLKMGEIVTLIGPNGAGKSTILKTIAKQLQEICGSVYVENINLSELPEKELAKKMSIVFTERITPELMTVADVVAMGRYPYTGGLGILTPKDEAVVAQCMEQIRISPLKERNFMSLSDGQKQRVLLAKALCQEPEILILDEPTSYLDVKYKLEFLSMLQEMTRKKKIGVLMSLHELDLAERVSDKIVCVKGENIENYGTPEEVFGSFMKFALQGNGYRTFAGAAQAGKPNHHAVLLQQVFFVFPHQHFVKYRIYVVVFFHMLLFLLFLKWPN